MSLLFGLFLLFAAPGVAIAFGAAAILGCFGLFAGVCNSVSLLFAALLRLLPFFIIGILGAMLINWMDGGLAPSGALIVAFAFFMAGSMFVYCNLPVKMDQYDYSDTRMVAFYNESDGKAKCVTGDPYHVESILDELTSKDVYRYIKRAGADNIDPERRYWIGLYDENGEKITELSVYDGYIGVVNKKYTGEKIYKVKDGQNTNVLDAPYLEKSYRENHSENGAAIDMVEAIYDSMVYEDGGLRFSMPELTAEQEELLEMKLSVKYRASGEGEASWHYPAVHREACEGGILCTVSIPADVCVEGCGLRIVYDGYVCSNRSLMIVFPEEMRL